MLTDIEKNIYTRLELKGLPVPNMDIRQGVDGIVTPRVNIFLEEGTISRIGNKFKVTLTVFLDVVFKQLQNEYERRKGIYPILEAVLNILTLQKLGLDISALVPIGFKNITSTADYQAGELVFQITFQTSYMFEETTEEEDSDLLAIAISQYLDPGTMTMWQPDTDYILGAYVVPTESNGHRYRATTGGLSHATAQPTWPTGAGATVADRSIIWQESGVVQAVKTTLNS